jgi:[acyl-carrier-protein] S-malonyltransferase
MSRYLLGQFPKAKALFEEASDACNTNILHLCTEGDEETLKLTENTQPCILTHSIATWQVLQQELGLQPHVFAGHSLGEYTALVASQRLNFADSVRLVKARGAAMQAAVPPGVGAMAAIMKFGEAKVVDEACQGASTAENAVQVANYNSPEQIVISGHASAVDRALELLKAKGAVGKKLAVSAPFHSKLMEPAQGVMAPLIASCSFADSEYRIIPNVSAEAVTRYEKDFLVQQITGSVRWTHSVLQAERLDCTTMLEIGPGKVLVGLAKRMVKNPDMILQTTEGEALLSLLQASSKAK